MKLSFKLILLNIVTNVVLASILVGITTHNLSEEMDHQAQISQEKSMKVAWRVLREKSNDFKVKDGLMMNDTEIINNNFAVVDSIKEIVGGTATIFLGDTRISTNVLKPDGSRAIGTQLAKGKVYDTVLQNGKPYRGQADILGTPYFTAYDPIVSASGQVIGILYVGVKKAEFFDVVESLLLKNIGYTVLILLLSSLAAYYLTGALLKPLVQLNDSMSKLSSGQGDLTVRIPIDNTKDEIGIVAESFNRFIAGLQAIIRELLDQSSQISRSASEFAGVAEQVAQGSRRQNETVAAIVASMDHMTGSIGVVSQSTREAETISREAGEHARQGEQVVQEASAEINRIADSVTHIAQTVTSLGQRSNEISGIVKVIKEIAEQTNLLALNAAIEAARAGEQGRGFAVVADEVRKLAERTGSATQEIGSMIASIQNETQSAVNSMESGKAQVHQGVLLANQAGDSLARINDGSVQTARVIADISDATRQGNTASGEIALGVAEIAKMAQERVEISHTISESAQQLEQVATKLHNVVGKFRV
jgi:methyl-accepting chemotaxis protein